MDSVKTSRKQAAQPQANDGARRPRRRIAKDMLERGRRLRNRAGVLIGVSMGVVALLTVME
ncbi:MAG: hypothetical protein JWP72_2789 [Massilia sp.]|nr:hypothetical protein [Massilia sp.]MDB5790834.1 hypothetical protein [Massilia sp.]